MTTKPIFFCFIFWRIIKNMAAKFVMNDKGKVIKITMDGRCALSYLHIVNAIIYWAIPLFQNQIQTSSFNLTLKDNMANRNGRMLMKWHWFRKWMFFSWEDGMSCDSLSTISFSDLGRDNDLFEPCLKSGHSHGKRFSILQNNCSSSLYSGVPSIAPSEDVLGAGKRGDSLIPSNFLWWSKYQSLFWMYRNLQA